MSSRRTTVLMLGFWGALFAVACSGSITDDVVVGNRGAGQGLIAPDATVPSPDASDAPSEAGTCPTNVCSGTRGTCSTSRFPCDVDLATDALNCGECGFVCSPPDVHPPGGNLSCVSGRCTMRCDAAHADCDQIPDNGCEVEIGTNANCGGCGNACPDGQPCTEGVCGCPSPKTNCEGSCHDLTSDPHNCGACGHECTDDEDAGPMPANMTLACVAGQCARVCSSSWENCNGDWNDGCEINVVNGRDVANCGACGVACAEGQPCDFGSPKSPFKQSCLCPEGTRNCAPAGQSFRCVEIDSDISNCGGCGRVCPGATAPNGRRLCIAGTCEFTCSSTFVDCNGSVEDGCEIDVRSDPDNCGACGVKCDGVAGQPCIEGRCAVEECGGIK